jgi:hypothetical protein
MESTKTDDVGNPMVHIYRPSDTLTLLYLQANSDPTSKTHSETFLSFSTRNNLGYLELHLPPAPPQDLLPTTLATITSSLHPPTSKILLITFQSATSLSLHLLTTPPLKHQCTGLLLLSPTFPPPNPDPKKSEIYLQTWLKAIKGDPNPFYKHRSKPSPQSF